MNNFCSAFRISGRVYNRMYFVFKGKWTYNCEGRGGVLISGGAHKRQFTAGIALSSPFIDYLKFQGFSGSLRFCSCKEERSAAAKGQSSFSVRNSVFELRSKIFQVSQKITGTCCARDNCRGDFLGIDWLPSKILGCNCFSISRE